MVKEDDLQHLSSAFKAIDKDNTGMINVNELEIALRESGHILTAIEIKKIM
jgi:Ca2+-binding EF-hand superfamily protein